MKKVKIQSMQNVFKASRNNHQELKSKNFTKVSLNGEPSVCLFELNELLHLVWKEHFVRLPYKETPFKSVIEHVKLCFDVPLLNNQLEINLGYNGNATVINVTADVHSSFDKYITRMSKHTKIQELVFS